MSSLHFSSPKRFLLHFLEAVQRKSLKRENHRLSQNLKAKMKLALFSTKRKTTLSLFNLVRKRRAANQAKQKQLFHVIM